MQRLFIVPFLIMSSLVFGQQRLLETENFTITISSQCEEGEVQCGRYQYVGVNKQSGRSIRLPGTSWHRKCADGYTPCQFLGYRFKNRNVTYFISEEGGLAVVTDKGKILLQESGRWQSIYDQ